MKLFVTHGGLLSAEESLFHGVPMLVMPGFGDQFANAMMATRMGYGLELRWTALSEDAML